MGVPYGSSQATALQRARQLHRVVRPLPHLRIRSATQPSNRPLPNRRKGNPGARKRQSRWLVVAPAVIRWLPAPVQTPLRQNRRRQGATCCLATPQVSSSLRTTPHTPYRRSITHGVSCMSTFGGTLRRSNGSRPSVTTEALSAFRADGAGSRNNGFMRNLRNGFYDLGVPRGDVPLPQAPRLVRAWDDLTLVLRAA